jgi:hypothetical protein
MASAKRWQALLGVTAAAALLASLACAERLETAPDTRPFLGTWDLAPGNLNINCQGLGMMAQTISGVVVVQSGLASDLEMTFTDPALAGCALRLDVRGQSALARANQTCPFTYLLATGTFTVRSGALVPSQGSAPESATLAFTGTLSATLPNTNVVLNCEGTVNGNLLRDGLPDAAADPNPNPGPDAASADTGSNGQDAPSET